MSSQIEEEDKGTITNLLKESELPFSFENIESSTNIVFSIEGYLLDYSIIRIKINPYKYVRDEISNIFVESTYTGFAKHTTFILETCDEDEGPALKVQEMIDRES